MTWPTYFRADMFPQQKCSRKTAAKQRSAPTEYFEQKALCQWLAMKGFTFFSVPNEGVRNYRNAARLKATGLTPGAPDLVLVDLAPDGRPVAIEMKARDGRLSDAQKALHPTMSDCGWHVIVAYGCRDAVEKINSLYRRQKDIG